TGRSWASRREPWRGLDGGRRAGPVARGGAVRRRVQRERGVGLLRADRAPPRRRALAVHRAARRAGHGLSPRRGHRPRGPAGAACQAPLAAAPTNAQPPAAAMPINPPAIIALLLHD